VRSTGDKELSKFCVEQCGQRAHSSKAKNIAPFNGYARHCKRSETNATPFCVSQTPTETLLREWQEHDCSNMCGLLRVRKWAPWLNTSVWQPAGNMSEDKIMVIGDAPGDLQAARQNNALFYPINPGKEADSWERFYKEALALFLEGKYRGSYENTLVRASSHRAYDPPWKAKNSTPKGKHMKKKRIC
jgi:hypothetical protein